MEQRSTSTTVGFKPWKFEEALRETWWVFVLVLGLALAAFAKGSDEAAVACVIVAGVYLVYVLVESSLSRYTMYRCPRCDAVSYDSEPECDECGWRFRDF